MRPVLAFALVAVPLLAQEKPQKIDARWFLPPEHERLAVVDFVALRDSELWESVRASALAVVLPEIERELGTPIDRIDRLSYVGVLPEEGEQQQGGPSFHHVIVYEGNGPLGDPEQVCGGWEKRRIGEHDAYTRSGWFSETNLWPRPDLRVQGSTEVVESLLERKPQPGMPCADLLSLLAGKTRPVAFLAGSLAGSDGPRAMGNLLPGTTWPEGHEPTFFAVRLLLEVPEGGDQPQVRVHVTIRHAAEDKGMDVTQQAVEALLEQGKKDRRLAVVHKVLRTAAVTRDGIDLHVRFDCGRERDAAGVLSSALAMGGLALSIGQAVRQVQVAVPLDVGTDEVLPEGDPMPKPEGGGETKPDAPRGGGR